MEAGKRKRSPEDKYADEDIRKEASAAPREEEVEQFFSILRRMQVAVKYFEKSKSNELSPIPATEMNDRPKEVEAEAIEGIGSVNDDGDLKKGKRMEEDCLGFDLNADPPESDTEECSSMRS